MTEALLSWHERAKKALGACQKIVNERYSREECRERILLGFEEIINRLNAAEASIHLLNSLEEAEIAAAESEGFLRIKLQRLNIFRITLIDLSEICELIAYCYRVSRIGNPHSPDGRRILTIVLKKNTKHLRSSSSDLIENGHEHVTKVRNTVVHNSIGSYLAHIAQYQTSERRLTFEFDSIEAPLKDVINDYYQDLFDPLCQLGTRGQITENDFLRNERRQFMNGIFSAGKLVADMMEALINPLESEATAHS